MIPVSGGKSRIAEPELTECEDQSVALAPRLRDEPPFACLDAVEALFLIGT
jgi:hypothetical protein